MPGPDAGATPASGRHIWEWHGEPESPWRSGAAMTGDADVSRKWDRFRSSRAARASATLAPLPT